MNYYITPWTSTEQEGETVIIPTGVTDEMTWNCIDLRATKNLTKAVGYALLATESTLDSPAILIATGMNSSLSNAVLNGINNRLGITLQANTLGGVLKELFTLHADNADNNKLNRVMAAVGGRQSIFLGNEEVELT